jgi:murein L,D-transpeptidase YcbB/YkuD
MVDNVCARAPRALWRWLIAIVLLGVFHQRLLAQEVDELIRAHVEELSATGQLTIDGAPIASINLIPRIYEAQAFAPTWRAVAQIDALLEAIEESYLEGLDPADYNVAAVRAARAAFANVEALTPAERAGIDITLTDSLIRLGYHMRFGKIDPIELDAHWNLSRALVSEDPAKTIQEVIDAPSMLEFARTLLPRNPFYLRLKRTLADYRAIAAAGGWPSVSTGPTLKPGMRDARVPELRARLTVTGDIDANGGGAEEVAYEGEIVAGVRRFQERHGLAADGAVGSATLAVLNVPVEARIEQIRINLERTRWVMSELAEDFVVVNIAGFRLYLVRGGEPVWTTRVQVGQPYRRTPVFVASLRYLVFSPTWTVPPTILRRDVLPAVRRDLGYLAARGIDVIDDSGMVVDAAAVDWSSPNLPYRLVQRPGPNNALGRVKFMFPNEHFVYLHDTPSRDLFDRESRAFSSGCIRVEHPLDLARLLLGEGWSQERIDAALAAGRTETVFLDDPIPVLLLYWTAEVDAAGRVVFHPDVYARDAEVALSLAGPFRASARL